MTAPAPFTPAGEWAAAYGVALDDANRAIVAAGSSPTSFSASFDFALTGKTYTVTGDFGPWQLVGTGATDVLCLTIPVARIAITPCVPSAMDPTPLGATVSVAVLLRPLAAPVAPAGTDAVIRISEVQMNDPARKFFAEPVALALGPWFLAHTAPFEQVFQSAGISRQVAAPGIVPAAGA